MKIAALTRYKHGKLFEILKRLDWTQSELARRAGMQPVQVGTIINLQRRPTEEQANKIQNALGEAGEFLDVLEEWPETFKIKKGFRRVEVQDIPMERLIDHPEVLQIEAPAMTDAEQDMQEEIAETMARMPAHYKTHLERRFWDGETHAEIARTDGICHQAAALRDKYALREFKRSAPILGTIKHKLCGEDWIEREIQRKNEEEREAQERKAEREAQREEREERIATEAARIARSEKLKERVLNETPEAFRIQTLLTGAVWLIQQAVEHGLAPSHVFWDDRRQMEITIQLAPDHERIGFTILKSGVWEFETGLGWDGKPLHYRQGMSREDVRQVLSLLEKGLKS